MRTTTALVGFCLAVAFAITTCVSAQAEQNRPAGVAAEPAPGEAVVPPAEPTGPARLPVRESGGTLEAPTHLPVRAPGGMIAAPLTVNECQGLGGKVTNADSSVCATGKQCETSTSTGFHQQCITKIE